MHDVRRKMARGAVWMLLFKLLDRGIGLISTLILARLLTPDNFGVVAMAMSFIGVLELFGAFGFDTALIQNANAGRSHFDTAWTFNVIFGCSIGVLMLLLSVPVAYFYHQPQLTPVVCTLAIGSMLQGAQNVGVVMFRKDLDFGKEFRFLLTKRIATFPLTIALALLLRNYWALVAGMVTGRVFDLWLSYRLHPFRPRFSFAAASELMHFSKWLLGFNVLGLLKDRAADFILGRVAGAHPLGIFSISYEISNMPGSELVAPINRAVYPVYARIKHDSEALRREYLAVMGMICLLAIPAVAGLAATANLIVPLVLGPNWLAAIPVMQVLAFFGILQVMQSNATAVFLAIGRADISTKLTSAYVALLLLMLMLTVRVSNTALIGAAIAYLTTALIMLPVGVKVILSVLDLRLGVFLGEVWRPLTASALMFAIARSYAAGFSAKEPVPVLLFHLSCTAVLGVVAYLLFAAVLWWLSGRPDSAERIVVRKVRETFGAAFERLRSRPGE